MQVRGGRAAPAPAPIDVPVEAPTPRRFSTLRGAASGNYRGARQASYVSMPTVSENLEELRSSNVEELRSGAQTPTENDEDTEDDQFSEQGETSAELERQFADTEKKYGGREAFDKAKSKGETKLNYRQWIQVRMQNFRNWFGDWKALWDLTIAKFSMSKADAETELAKLNGRDLINLEQWITAQINVTQANKLVSEAAITKSMANGFTREQHYAIASKIESLWEHAAQIGEYTDVNGIRIRRFAAPFVFNGETRFATMLAKETVKHGRRVYTVELHEIDTLRGTLDKLASPQDASTSQAPTRSVEETIRQLSEKVNPDSVSKVIDPETGEPRVVYHGTNADFSAFSRARIGSAKDSGFLGTGFYFSASPKIGAAYGDHLMPLFVSIRNPVQVALDVRTTKPNAIRKVLGLPLQTNAQATRDQADEITDKARQMGHDGVVLDYSAFGDRFAGDTEFVAFDPTQIKSAIGNTGAFDPANPDIRLSESAATHSDLPAHAPDFTPATVENITSSLKRWFFTPRRFDDFVTVHATQAEALAATGVRPKAGRRVRGFVHEGRAHLVAENIAEGDALSVFLHETGVHLGMERILGAERMRLLTDQVKSWARRSDESVETQAAQWAMGRASESSSARKEAEIVAYMVEALTQAGITPQAARSPGGDWLRKFFEAVKAALRRLGLRNPEKLTGQDLVDMAYGAARIVVEGRVGAPGETSAELERQFADTEKKYGGREAFERAKRAGLTELNYRQWVQVRTPNFLRWFGNWMSAHLRKKLRFDDPTQITGREVGRYPLANLTEAQIKAMREDARVWALEHVAGEYDNVLTGHQFEVRKAGIDSAISHYSGPDKLRVFAAIPDILRNGVVVFDGENPRKAGERLVVVAKQVSIGETGVSPRKFMVSAGLREDANGRLFYDHELLSMERAGGLLSEPEAASSASAPTPARLNDFTIRFLRQRDDVSRALNRKTGEPKVMYHGTRDDVPVFIPGVADAIFVSPDESFVMAFLRNHKEMEGASTMPVFVNVRKPFDPRVKDDLRRLHARLLSIRQEMSRVRWGTSKDKNDLSGVIDRVSGALNGEGVRDIYGNIEGVEYWGFIESPDVQLAIRLEGHDGFFVRESTALNTAVYSPTQIKSAIGNTGAFGRTDLRTGFSEGQDTQAVEKSARSPQDDTQPAASGAPRGTQFSTTASDLPGPIPESERLSEALIAQVVEERIGQFRHQPPILVRDSVVDVPGMEHVRAGTVAGLTFDGRIYLFRDANASVSDTVRTLWHEMNHYGLRRFLTRDQYIAEMQRLYERDPWIKERADAWLASGEEDASLARRSGEDYARARGVDEALSALAEINEGEYRTNTLLARAVRQVARWVAEMAERFGFHEVAARYRAVSNDEARALVRSLFQKMREDAPATSSDWAFTADPAFSFSESAPDSFARKTSAPFVERVIAQMPERAQEPARVVADNLREFLKQGLYTLSFGHDLADAIGKVLPSAKQYFELMGAKSASRTHMEAEIARIMQRAAHLKEKDKTALNAFLKDSTLSQRWGFQPEWNAAAVVDAEARQQFNRLTPEAQAVAKEIFRNGFETHAKMRALLEASIARMPEKLRGGAMRRFNEVLPKMDGPYAPLMRFGNYVTVAKSKAYLQAVEEFIYCEHLRCFGEDALCPLVC
jgi:hypothetical protein